MGLFARYREFVSRFMLGRYGTDRLNRHLVILWFFVVVANLFLKSPVLYVLQLVFCFVCFFRMFSRNVLKRQNENRAYTNLFRRMTKGIRHFFVRIRDRKTTRFFHCPHCSAPIRMPRKIGKFKIRCQKCQNVFVKEFKK